MFENEQKIFITSLNYLQKHQNFHDRLLYTYLWYEAVIELCNKFHQEFGWSDKEITNLNLSIDELSIALKHTMWWYYSSAHVHLRIVFETIIETVFTKLVSKQHQKQYKQENGSDYLSMKHKILLSIKYGQNPWSTLDLEQCVCNIEEIFTSKIMTDLYGDLSNVVHRWYKNKEIFYNSENLSETLKISIKVMEYLGKFMTICYHKTIIKHRNSHFEYADDIPCIYAKPIRYIVCEYIN